MRSQANTVQQWNATKKDRKKDAGGEAAFQPRADSLANQRGVIDDLTDFWTAHIR